jgi:WbqC-like protein family.
MNYKRSKYFNEIFEDLFKIYNNKEITILSEFNSSIIEYIVEKIGIKTKIIYSRDFNINVEGTERLIEIIKRCEGTVYFSGKGGEKYQDENKFRENNIDLIYTDFKHPVYEQLWGKFIPYLSMLDLLFNYGEECLDIIKKSFK